MRSDKEQTSGLTTKQKVTAIALIVVIGIIVWQVVGLFRGSSAPAAPATPPTTTPRPITQTPQHATPAAADLQPALPTTQREMELMRLQQATEAKYLAAVNELQMLKLARDIAETNQAISTAKLATVTAEKNIVNLLTPQVPVTPADYARSLVNPVASGSTVPPTQAIETPVVQPTVSYTVISVSQLQYRWTAVLGYQGNLYNVAVGDLLPADGSKVISINRNGVILEKDGVRKRVSLVPII